MVLGEVNVGRGSKVALELFTSINFSDLEFHTFAIYLTGTVQNQSLTFAAKNINL